MKRDGEAGGDRELPRPESSQSQSQSQAAGTREGVPGGCGGGSGGGWAGYEEEEEEENDDNERKGDDESDNEYRASGEEGDWPPAARRDVRELYDAGVPWYTREGLEDVEAQLSEIARLQQLQQQPLPSSLSSSFSREEESVEGGVYGDMESRRRAKLGPSQVQVRTLGGGWVARPATPIWHLQATLLPKIRFKSYQDTLYSNTAAGEQCAVDIRHGGLSYRAGRDPGPVLVAYEARRRRWEGSPARAELEGLLRGRVGVVPPGLVDKVICFGLGSFEEEEEEADEGADGESCGRERDDDGELATTRTSVTVSRHMRQHAVAETVARVLGGSSRDSDGDGEGGGEGRTGVALVAQEPRYGWTCKEVLRRRGFDVVEGHGALGFAMVDSRAVVVSFDCNAPVKQIVADMAAPAAMLWEASAEFGGGDGTLPAGGRAWKREVGPGGGYNWVSPDTTNPESPRTLKLLERYIAMPLREKESPFHGAVLYVRRDLLSGQRTQGDDAHDAV